MSSSLKSWINAFLDILRSIGTMLPLLSARYLLYHATTGFLIFFPGHLHGIKFHFYIQ